MKIIKYEFFGKVLYQKNSYFTEILVLHDFHTLPKNSYLTKKFVLNGKFRMLDVQVLSL